MTKRKTSRKRQRRPAKSAAEHDESVPSQRALARRLSVSLKAVQKWTVHPYWRWGRGGPFPVDPIIRWRLRVLRDDPSQMCVQERDQSVVADELAAMELRLRVKIKLDLERTAKLKIQREILRRRHVCVSDEIARLRRLEAATNTLLADLRARVEKALSWMDEFDRGRALEVMKKSHRDVLRLVADRIRDFEIEDAASKAHTH